MSAEVHGISLSLFHVAVVDDVVAAMMNGSPVAKCHSFVSSEF